MGANLDTSTRQSVVDTSNNLAVVEVVFDAPYALQEADIMLMGMTPGATGTLVPGSLQATGSPTAPSERYQFLINSVQPGERYTVSVMSATDACMTALTGGSFTVNMATEITDTQGFITEVFGGTAQPFPDAMSSRILPYHVTYTDNEGWPASAATTSYRVISVPMAQSITIRGTYSVEGGPYDYFDVYDGSSASATRYFRGQLSQGPNTQVPFSVTVPGNTVVLTIASDHVINSVEGYLGYTIEGISLVP